VGVLTGHTGPVRCLVEWNSFIYSGSEDKSIRKWSPTGQPGVWNCVQVMVGHTDTVRCLYPLGGVLFSGSWDKTVRCWGEGGEMRAILQGHSKSVRALHSLGGYLYTGSWDKTIRVWNSAGTCMSVLRGHSDWIGALQPFFGLMYSASVDKTIRAWDPSGRCVQVLEGHTAAVETLTVSADTLYSGSADRTIRLWSRVGTCLRVIEGLRKQVSSLEYAQGLLFACSCQQKNVRALSDKGATVIALKGHTKGVWCLIMHSSGLAVTGSDDRSVRVWRTGPTVNLANLATPALVDPAPVRPLQICSQAPEECLPSSSCDAISSHSPATGIPIMPRCRSASNYEESDGKSSGPSRLPSSLEEASVKKRAQRRSVVPEDSILLLVKVGGDITDLPSKVVLKRPSTIAELRDGICSQLKMQAGNRTLSMASFSKTRYRLTDVSELRNFDVVHLENSGRSWRVHLDTVQDEPFEVNVNDGETIKQVLDRIKKDILGEESADLKLKRLAPDGKVTRIAPGQGYLQFSTLFGTPDQIIAHKQ